MAQNGAYLFVENRLSVVIVENDAANHLSMIAKELRTF